MTKKQIKQIIEDISLNLEKEMPVNVCEINLSITIEQNGFMIEKKLEYMAEDENA